MTLNSSLLKWLATFQLDDGTFLKFDDEAYFNLADGYLCARILNKISPKYFSNEWLEGIKPVEPGGRWPLRVSNLKRILQKIHDYTSDLQNSQFRPDIIKPDVLVIAQNFDAGQINKLIQLLLFCAINCDEKEQYIEKIRELPTQIKQDIKEAIEELLIQDNTATVSSKKEPNTSRLGSNSSSDANEAQQHGPRTSSPITRFNTSSSNITSSNLSPIKTPTERAGLKREQQTSQDNTFKFSEGQNETLFSPSCITYGSSNRAQSNNSVEDIHRQLNAALIDKDERAQACHELELKLKELQLEKEQLVLENERLMSGYKSKQSTTPKKHFYLGKTISSKYSPRQPVEDLNHSNKSQELHDEEDDSDLASKQITKLHNELNRLKEDLIKVEAEREEYKLRTRVLEEDLDRATLKHNELRDRAEQAKRLQDELDEQRHISEKVLNYEAMVDNLIKKNNDLKRDIKVIEEKNTSYVQKIVRLEEDNKQLTIAVSRKDIYKERFQESQMKLSQETHRADKTEVELNRLAEKYASTVKENEKLHEATSQLKRQTSIDRCVKLEIENKQFLKRSTLLDGKLRDSSQMVNASTSAQNITDSSSDNTLALLNRVEELQRLLFQKEQELLDSETKYKRNLQKAKDVIKSLNNSQSMSSSLHASCMSSASSFNSSSLDEFNMLKQQLKEREDRLIELEREFYEYKKFKEIHERLIISAFYGLVSCRNYDFAT